jgi:MFS family permease
MPTHAGPRHSSGRDGLMPGPELTPPSGLLAPFRVRGYRFLWTADLMTASAIEMEVLILGWYILVETGSVVLLATLGAMQYAGSFVAPMAGMLGDRLGLRRLLVSMRAIYTVLASVLTTLALLGLLNPYLALAIAGIASIARASDIGMRAALCAEILPLNLLMRAIGVSRTTSDAARATGALTGAGLFGLLGIAPAYAIVAVCHLAGCLLTFGAKRPEDATNPVPVRRAPRVSPWRDVKDGLAYVWRTPHLNAAVWLAFLANLTALPVSSGLLPYVAREVYHLDQNGLGVLVACFALGALVGSLGVSIAGGRIRAGRIMMTSAAIWYVILIVFAQLPTPAGGMMMLVLAGFSQSLCMVPLAGMMLRTSSVELRGRVMGARMLAINSLPIGLMIAGPLIQRIGFRTTITIYAVSGLILTLAIALHWRKSLLPLDAPANRS